MKSREELFLPTVMYNNFDMSLEIGLLYCFSIHFQTNIGLMLHSKREFSLACKYLEHSCMLQMKFHGVDSLHTATGHHLVARALSALGNYKKALSSEKSTHSIYEKHVSYFRVLEVLT